MNRWLVLVNQAAGSKTTPVEAVRSVLASESIDADIEVPATVEETVTVLHNEARAGRTHFIVAGGDGTISLAAHSLLEVGLEKPTLGVLPTGTGCDLLRTFGLPHDLAGAAKHLSTEEVYDIDVVALDGAWGRRYYVNVAEVGVGAAAVETASRMARRIGSARYPLAFAGRLGGFKRANVKVTTERRTYESPALAVFMANAQFFGGGWNLAPRATLIDGVLDIQVIDAKKTRAPALLPKVIKGTHLSDPAVKRFTAAEFRIETDIDWPLEADGDLIGNTPVEGRVVPAAIRLKI